MLRIRFFCFALLLSLIPIAAIAVPTWKSIGPFGGYVMDIAVHPLNPSVVYAISYRGGVFKSMDAGGSWRECNNDLVPHNAVAIALDPADVNVAYVGLYTDGVFKTLDGGASWSRSSNGLPTDILQVVAADPANSSVLFAGYRNGGIYRTTNSGASWSRVFSGPPESDRMTAVKVAPGDSNVLYVSYTGGLFRSTDGGTTWLQVTGAPSGIGSLAIDPRDSNRLLFAVSWGILLTLDGGSTWERTNTELTFDVEIHPANPSLVFCDHAISTDGGLTWAETVHTYPCFPNRISLDPSNPAIILENAGEDFYGKGICKSTDGGVTWAQSNKGLNNTVVIHFALDPFNRGRVFAHTGQSGGLFYTKNAGMTWKDTGLTGTYYGAAILVHPSIPNVVFAGGSKGNEDPSVWRSTDGGATFSSISGEVWPWWTLTTDPFDPQTMYCPTYEGVLKSTDGGFHWTPTQGINSGAYEVAADPLVQGQLYASTASEGVMKSTDGGMNWAPSNNGLTDLQVESLVLDRNNPSSLYATTPTGLFRTTNGGSNWELRAKKYIRPTISPSDSQILYGGTLHGVVVSFDAGRTWRSMGLEGISVTNIAFDPFDPHILYAATFGNGIYQMHLEPGPGSKGRR